MRVRRCGSVRSDCRLSAERGNSQHRHRHQQQYPKMIPAIAADRRLRQKVAAKRGARTVTSIDLLTLPLHVGELSRWQLGPSDPSRCGASLRCPDAGRMPALGRLVRVAGAVMPSAACRPVKRLVSGRTGSSLP